MKKLLLAGLLSVLAFSANANLWDYNLLKDDFDGDTRTASITADSSEVELMLIKNKVRMPDEEYAVFFLLPLGVLTSNCEVCKARVIADGKEVEPIKLLAAYSFKEYFLRSGDEAFVDLFKNNKVIKIQLPTSRNRRDLKETLTFTQTKLLSLKELDAAK